MEKEKKIVGNTSADSFYITFTSNFLKPRVNGKIIESNQNTSKFRLLFNFPLLALIGLIPLYAILFPLVFNIVKSGKIGQFLYLLVVSPIPIFFIWRAQKRAIIDTFSLLEEIFQNTTE
jgi:hypothetical protein